MADNAFGKMLSFLNKLDDMNIPFYLEHNREETIMVSIAAPDERWEVEFYADGDVDVEVFYGEGEDVPLEGEDALMRLFDKFDEESENN